MLGLRDHVSGAEIRSHSQCNFVIFFPIWRKKIPIKAKNNIKHSEIQTLLFEIVFNFDYKLSFNDSKIF